MIMLRSWIALITLFFCAGIAASDPASEKIADAEINYLIQAVGNSGCTFLRNGTEHSPKDAESHMRLKYKNGKRWAGSAEQFIERLATKSSWTGKPYYLLCKGKQPQLSSTWMTDQLAAYRASKNNPRPAEKPEFVRCEDPRPQLCTMIYDPVCGTSDNGTQQTYASDCSACSNAAVIGYTKEKCPD